MNSKVLTAINVKQNINAMIQKKNNNKIIRQITKYTDKLAASNDNQCNFQIV